MKANEKSRLKSKKKGLQGASSLPMKAEGTEKNDFFDVPFLGLL
jgi:hypothetical protein